MTVTVEPPVGNRAPDADDDATSTPQGTSTTIIVLGNDDDPDGDSLTVIGASDPPNGSVVVNGDGTITYTPDPGFEGTDTFTYTVRDPDGLTDTATVSVDVGDPTSNTPPEADPDIPSTDVDTPVVISVLDNDSDPDGDPISVTAATDPTNGSVLINGDGTITYTPDPGFEGTDTFSYTITDTSGEIDTALVTVTVGDGGANAAPDADPDTTATPQGTSTTIIVLGNDDDPDGDPITVIGATDPPNGSVVVNGDGTITYTPDPGFEGSDTFSYTIRDTEGLTDTATVTVAVGDPTSNVAPVAGDDTTATAPDTPTTITVLSNDGDADGDPISISAATDPDNGTVIVNGDGTITYFPDAGFEGVDTFSYTITDTSGEIDTATVTITVGDPDANDPPEADDDATTTPQGTPTTIVVLGNDSDPDGDALTITGTTDPANGSITVNPSGTITYTPDPGFEGTDTFTYTVTDPDGETDTATVSVAVGDPTSNLPPDAGDDSGSTAPGSPTTITVLGNDSDPDGDPITVSAVTDPANGTAVVNGDGTITYTPDPGFEGTDTFSYTITDTSGVTDTATVVIRVDDGNAEPVAVDDATSTAAGIPTTFAVLTNDGDPDGDPLTVTGVTSPTNGTAVVNGDNTITYTPDGGFTGTDSVVYTISDGNGGIDTATLTITVSDDGVPVAADDTAQALPEETIIIDVLANDSDPDGQPLSTVTATDPPNGLAIVNGDNTITYIPDAGFTGEDTFTYDIIDTDGNTDTALVTVTVGEGRIDTDVFPVDAGLQPLDPFDGLDEDPNPADDLDFVVGTTGADFIQTGDDADTIIANGGADTIFAGIDDDSVQGGGGDDLIFDIQGADTIGGGSGNDTINAGTNSYSDYDDGAGLPLPPGLGFDRDPNTGDGRDSVFGGVGDDSILTGDDSDTIDAGDDDDFVDGGIDDDSIFGAGGDDTLVGFHGADTIDGGQGADFIDAGNPEALEIIDDDGASSDTVTENDRDSVIGGIGDDTIFTGDDADTIFGNGGNDNIDAGIDDDSILGQGGIDTITGGQGSDFIDGGDEGDIIDARNVIEREIVDALDSFEGDDRDTVIGGRGDDIILTGDDDDLVFGDQGDDTIDTGIDEDTVDGGDGNDEITTGQGSDSVLGGRNDDTIDAGNTEDREEVDDTDTLPDDDRDFVDGGEGADVIFTGDDDDTILGGADFDFIDAGIDDDSVDGGGGNDTIFGLHGSDTILGGDGSDLIDARNTETGIFGELIDSIDTADDNDRDSVDGGTGQDTILTGDDDDTIDGGDGDDVIDAGIDDDSVDGGDGRDDIEGGAGNDTIDGGLGRDTISGGADRDTIIVRSVEEGRDDVIDGGSEGDDFDRLDLTGLGVRGEDWRIVDDTPDSNGNGIDGTIQFFNSTAGVFEDLFEFTEIEEIVPCFTPGTTIATPAGERLVEDLREGDRVITRDNGLQEIRWIGQKELTGHQLARRPHLRPVLVQAGSLGPNLPENDMLVSPNHRILVSNDKTSLYFEEREVLASAKHLIGLDGVDEVGTLGVTYVHFMFEQHEVVLSNGAWTESFQPGDYTMSGMGDAQRTEIYELFPELKSREGLESYTSARRSLKKHEAQLITK